MTLDIYEVIELSIINPLINEFVSFGFYKSQKRFPENHLHEQPRVEVMSRYVKFGDGNGNKRRTCVEIQVGLRTL